MHAATHGRRTVRTANATHRTGRTQQRTGRQHVKTSRRLDATSPEIALQGAIEARHPQQASPAPLKYAWITQDMEFISEAASSRDFTQLMQSSTKAISSLHATLVALQQHGASHATQPGAGHASQISRTLMAALGQFEALGSMLELQTPARYEGLHPQQTHQHYSRLRNELQTQIGAMRDRTHRANQPPLVDKNDRFSWRSPLCASNGPARRRFASATSLLGRRA